MALVANPTQTTTIEKNWRREINRRTDRLLERVEADFARMIGNPKPNTPSGEFNPTELAKSNFIDGLRAALVEFQGQRPPLWWGNKYQKQSYSRGVERTLVQLYPPQERPELPFWADDNPTNLPMEGKDRDIILALYDRAHAASEKWVINTAREIESAMTQSVLENAVVDEIGLFLVVKNALNFIRRRIGVLGSREEVISQTETIQANQLASLNTVDRENERIRTSFTGAEGITDFERTQLENGGFKLRWVSMMDSRVRHLHWRFHGQIMTPAEAQVNVNISPWNCRCGLLGVNAAHDTEKENDKWRDELAMLIGSLPDTQ